MNKKTLNKKEVVVLTSKGIEGYNELVYRMIATQDYKKASKFANQKMDEIIKQLIDMSDEDVSVFSYVSAMIEDYKSSINCLRVLHEDGDVMKDEEHYDLYASVASALCYLKEDDKENANRMLKQALTFKPNAAHFGADEVVLNQARSLL